ncbi:hypothetical protein THASP1DRAFT_19180 [Thamnocephalis sphaerospora]|uniref:ABC transporter domain-containing protein n=1 Tax=Thamnocephalis sphaerospora TaxID=78915 RepID=A0A4P9XJH2_9FUNG|nr:hypothetical protein THASP1DRAFT_19180 [Thamnocephalis sphaerospora]|eukprot:RKP05905.1 hypothetical protein THASP1DRAFT_19180 [Thamnocephalis sphaerospora]
MLRRLEFEAAGGLAWNPLAKCSHASMLAVSQESTNCTYLSTPQQADNPGGETWNCPAGSFCMTKSHMELCPPGFMCPANTAQPFYCCSGHYCPTPGDVRICPEGKFCPLGSTDVQGCHFLARCPAGTGSVSRFGVAALFLGMMLVVVVFFAVKNRLDSLKRSKYQHLLQFGYADSDESAKTEMTQVERTFDISFQDLGLTLTNGIKIMSGVTGQLSSGRCCAILGPSGAGKTTFVSLLTGKAKKTSGTIMLNGVEEPLSKYQKLIGFVPQEDVMMRELTVRDILIHSALMRLPKDLPLHAKKKKVLETITYLELGHVMDSAIGDESKRGISGGQRKRVNIGMELVANPSVLFLDEPTSGLDSATSYEVCALLRNIAHRQRLTVAAVIHSPSPQAFNQFDDLLVLGKGGRVVYLGPRDQALDYFHRIGFTCPPEDNPADFYIAVASGKVRSAFSADFHPDDLFVYWERFLTGEEPFTPTTKKNKFHRLTILEGGMRAASEGRSVIGSFFAEIGTAVTTAVNDTFVYWRDIADELSRTFRSFVLVCESDPVRDTANAFTTFWLCYKRACMQIYRSRNQFIYDQLLHLGCGAFISIAARQFDYLGVQPESICSVTPAALQKYCRTPIDYIAQAGVFLALGVLFSGISVGAATFGNEKVVYWRDTSAGMKTLPYFLAKLIADLPRMFVAALCFSLSFIVFYPYRSKYIFILTIIALLYFVAFSMGYLISVLVSKETVGLVSTAFALAWAMLFSGTVPDLTEVLTDPMYRHVRWLWHASAPRYAIEALFIKEVAARPFEEIHNSKLPHEYNLDNYNYCLILLFCIGVSWNLLAIISMRLMHREKMK